MPPFSPAQSKSLPMKTRLKLKLAKIIQSEKNEERRSLKIKPINQIEDTAPALRRTHSSPSLRSLQETSWSIGRGKLCFFLHHFWSKNFISDHSFREGREKAWSWWRLDQEFTGEELSGMDEDSQGIDKKVDSKKKRNPTLRCRSKSCF